jgi:hypothetical protein
MPALVARPGPWQVERTDVLLGGGGPLPPASLVTDRSPVDDRSHSTRPATSHDAAQVDALARSSGPWDVRAKGDRGDGSWRARAGVNDSGAQGVVGPPSDATVCSRWRVWLRPVGGCRPT